MYSYSKLRAGWAFLLNGFSFAAVVVSMAFFRLSELRTSVRAQRSGGLQVRSR
jgi:hypothetical protein